jgi:acyl-CoA reductase-like NAD-dependent aldehyde dehydrogenase
MQAMPSTPAQLGTDWPLAERLAWVRRFRIAVARAREELCGLMASEVSKKPWEGLTSDLLPLLAACKWHERHAASLLQPRALSGGAFWQKGVRVRQQRAPLGRVAIIATWNYPVQLLGIQLLQALVAGNQVVVKPSERCPRTHARLLDLAREAGLPAAALTSTPATREAGEQMLAEHSFDHVLFTGSTEVGRRIASQLAPSLTPSTLELSGRDSAFVLADADAPLAARTLWMIATMNAGQTCMAPRRVLVERGAYAAFCEALRPLASGAYPVELIDEAAAQRAHSLAQDAIQLGGRSASGQLEALRGRSMRPVAVLDCPEQAPLVEGRHFGPAVAVVPVRDLDHALAIHRQCDQHLATSIFTRDVLGARHLAPRLGAKTVTINDCVIPTAHPAASIGGVGASGWGASRGREGLLALTRPVYVSVSGPVLRPSTDAPPTAMADRIAQVVQRWYTLELPGQGQKSGLRNGFKQGQASGNTAPPRPANDSQSSQPLVHEKGSR